MKFLSAIVLITYGIGVYYAGQIIMEERAKNEIAAAATSAQQTLLQQQQANINDFIRQHQ